MFFTNFIIDNSNSCLSVKQYVNIETFIPTKVSCSTTNLEVTVMDSLTVKVSDLNLNLSLNTNVVPTTISNTDEFNNDVTADIKSMIQKGSSVIGGFGF